MALVYRNGRAYAYKSIRRGGRITSEYRGSGARPGQRGARCGRAGRASQADLEERCRLDDAEQALDEIPSLIPSPPAVRLKGGHHDSVAEDPALS
jgi:hypothetical protein